MQSIHPHHSSDNIVSLHRKGFAELDEFWTKVSAIETEARNLQENAPAHVEEPIERLLETIESFEPSVGVIGQVKAGKSTLLNALIGKTDLLPSDVNPWTSVITNIHLNSRKRPPNTRALFRFFDGLEWDRLVTTGGRLGEIANRAGFEAEAKDVRGQVMEMRSQTEARLGEKFEDLLGSNHAFPDINKEVIDRYICYGDPDDEGALDEGVFADLTKSADLYLDLPGYPSGLALRDTPGVNDTFMMREQITINAISDSRVCVVVLSAHQALSTMDMALLRIICNVEAREVLIFVNRIDELKNPVEQTADIEESIRGTMANAGIDSSINIVFGSAYWATHALQNTCENMSSAAKLSLAKWTASKKDDLNCTVRLREMANVASGVNTLHKAIARRVVNGPGNSALVDMTAELENIRTMMETVENLSADVREIADDIDVGAVKTQLTTIQTGASLALESAANDARTELENRLSEAQNEFVSTALDALESHMSTFGERDGWTFDPTSLRMMMRTAYLSACSDLKRSFKNIVTDAADEYEVILQRDLAIFDEATSMELPDAPENNPPTALAKTLSLDLQGSWWRKFWKFGRQKESPSQKYEAVIREETNPLKDELIEDYFNPFSFETSKKLENFCSDQIRFISAVVDNLKNNEQSSRIEMEAPAGNQPQEFVA